MTERDPLAHHLYTMACNNAWANHRLGGVYSALTEAELWADRSSFFRSIGATANHLITVDWFYTDALERTLEGAPPHESPGTFFSPEHPFRDADRLLGAQRAVDLRLMHVCAGLKPADALATVRIRRATGESSDSLVRILAHLFQHQIHHRGQIHAMLSSTRLAPPPLDSFFCDGDLDDRAEGLAALGLSDEAIWDARLSPRAP